MLNMLLRVLNRVHIWTCLFSILLAFFLGSKRIMRQTWKQRLGLRIEQKWNRIFVPGNKELLYQICNAYFLISFTRESHCIYFKFLYFSFFFLVPFYFFPFSTLTNFYFVLGYVLCSYLLTQSCLPLYDPMDCSLPGSSIHEDSPGKNTGVGCHALSRGSFQPRDWTQVSHIKHRSFTSWATRETQEYRNG